LKSANLQKSLIFRSFTVVPKEPHPAKITLAQLFRIGIERHFDKRIASTTVFRSGARAGADGRRGA
jgi:hypothetical protein